MKTMLINYNSIAKETAKAICLNCQVYWGNGSMKSRDIWFPKSVVELHNEKSAIVSLSFIRNKEHENAFNGLDMTFEGQSWE